MKFNFVKTLLAIGISALMAFGFYNYQTLLPKGLVAASSFICLFVTLMYAVAVTFEHTHTTLVVRVVSTVFFFMAIVSNLVSTIFPFSVPMYIIINGVLILVYILLAYSAHNAKNEMK